MKKIIIALVLILPLGHLLSQDSNPQFSTYHYTDLIAKYEIEKASQFSFKDYSSHNNSVDKTTGEFKYNVNFYEIKNEYIQLPIGIAYNSSSNRVDDVSSVVGAGWELYATGQISRQINGICDDFYNPINSQYYFAKKTPGDVSLRKSYMDVPHRYSRMGFKGYMVDKDTYSYQSRRGNFSNYIFPNSTQNIFVGDHPLGTTFSENVHLETIAEMRSKAYDQPDVFRVKVGDLDFSFVFKNIQTKEGVRDALENKPVSEIELLNAKGYKVEWEFGNIMLKNTAVNDETLEVMGNRYTPLSVITKFIVTDKKGTKYYFENPELIHSQYLSEFEVLPNHIDWFEQIHQTTIRNRPIIQNVFYSYSTSNWKIKKIEFLNGQNIDFEYLVDTQINNVKIPRETSGEYFYKYNLIPKKPYAESFTELPLEKKVYHIKTIRTNYEEIDFQYSNLGSRTDYLQGGMTLGSVVIKNLINNSRLKKISFQQSNVRSNTDLIENNQDFNNPKNYRMYLNGIDDSTEELNHEFSYIDKTNFPPRLSSKQDLYGFYGNPNGSEFPFPKTYICPDLPVGERHRYNKPKNGITYYTLNGDDRTPVPSLLTKGLLNKITFPSKGSINVNYEPNIYKDEFSINKEALGPGVRVSELTYKDTDDSELKKISYDYSISTNNSNSSGSLPNLPAYGYVTNFGFDNQVDLSTLNSTAPLYIKEGEGLVTYHNLKNIRNIPTRDIWQKLTKRSTHPYSSRLDQFGRAIIYTRVVETIGDGDNGMVEYKNYPLTENSKTYVTRVSGPASDVSQPFPPPYGYKSRTYKLTTASIPRPVPYFTPYFGGINVEYGLVETEGYNIFPFPNRNYYKNLEEIKTGKLKEVNILDNENIVKKKTEYTYSLLKDESSQVRGIQTDYFASRNWNEYGGINNIIISDQVNPKFYLNNTGIYSYYENLFTTENKLMLTTEKVTDYFDNGEVSTISNYNYETQYGLLRNISKPNIDGQLFSQEYQYPHDINSGVYNNMVSNRNQLATIVKTENKIDNVTQSYTKNNYEQFSLEKIQYLPASVSTFKKEFNEESRIKINKYNKNGNVIEYQNEHDIPVTLIWAYKGKHVIAKIEGMSFEEINQAMVTSEGIHLINDAYDYYVKPTVNTLLQKIRIHANNAMVTTYSYQIPLGIQSITDPKGETVYYEYDVKNRLKYVKDHNGNVVNKYEYNFKN